MTNRNATGVDDFPEDEDGSTPSEALGFLFWLSRLATDMSHSTAGERLTVLESPRALGRFRLEFLLGSGAYGAVFRATDVDLDRQVALKIAWPAILMDAEASRRFVEEPRTVAALKHPGIVEVYDSGSVEMARFISLELVEGPTLADWLKLQDHVPIQSAAQIIHSVADAVEYAHAREIIHRDLKPRNILLRPLTAQNGRFPFQPVVTDFGLASRRCLDDASGVTATYAVLGTDRYMSPEQAAGRSSEVGPESDVFSIGVILYELVAGRCPFDGDSGEQIRERIQRDEPPPIRPWKKNVPKDIETIIFKCLEKEPTKRYASAGELAEDLRRFLDHEPILARPSSINDRAWKYVRKRPMAVSIVALATVSALVIAGLAGALVANSLSASREIDAARQAAAVSAAVERQHKYAADIQHANEALSRGNRREVIGLLEQCRATARAPVACGIEWDVLWAQVNGADRTLKAHPGGVYCARFSPDGALLVSAGKDGRVVIWDTMTWQPQSEYDDEIGDANVAEFSAEGSLIAYAGDDGRVIVRNVSDGSKLYDERIVAGRVYDLAWLGGSKQLAVGGEDAVLSIIDLESRSCRQTPSLEPKRGASTNGIRTNEISCLAYIPKLEAVAVGMAQGGVRLIGTASLMDVGPSIEETCGIGVMCQIPIDEGYLVLNGGNRGLRVWSLKDGSKVAEFPADPDIRVLRFSRAAKCLLAGSRNGIVQTWQVQGLLTARTLRGRRMPAHTGRASAIDAAPDGAQVVSGGEDGCLRIWRRGSISEPFDVPLREKPWAAEFSPCGRWLAILEGELGRPGRVTVFDAHLGNRLWSTEDEKDFEPHLERFTYVAESQLAFAPDGEELALLCKDFAVRGFDPRTGRTLRRYDLPADRPVGSIQFSPDGERLIAKRPLDDLFVVDRETGAVDAHVEDRQRQRFGLYRTKLGDAWLDIMRVGANRLRLVVSEQQIVELTGTSKQVTTVTVSDDGRFLAVGGDDRLIYFWDLDHVEPANKFVGDDTETTRLRFSSDGRTLFSHSADGRVRLWHLPTRALLLTIGSEKEKVTCLGLHPSGSLLVLGIEAGGHFGLKLLRLGRNNKPLPPDFLFATTEQSAEEAPP